MAAIGVRQAGASIRSQLSAFERRVTYFVRGKLLEAGKRIRRRMIDERLTADKAEVREAEKQAGRKIGAKERKYLLRRTKSGGGKVDAPLRRKTGTLIASIRYKTVKHGDVWVLDASIGGGKAYYAEQYEQAGRLQFGRITEQEMQRAQEEIRIGVEVIGRDARNTAMFSAGSEDGGSTDLSGDALSLREYWAKGGGRSREVARVRAVRRRQRAYKAYSTFSSGIGKLLGGRI